MPETNQNVARQSAILVVDDDNMMRKLAQTLLTPLGYRVITAQDGLEAMAIIARQPVAGILLDVMMPRMDGFEVCRQVKGNPATAHIPVILVTALSSPVDRQKGFEAGADEIIHKPMRPAHLVTIQQMIPVQPGLNQNR